MKSCRTIRLTLRVLSKIAIGATLQAQRHGRGQMRNRVQAQSPGSRCVRPSSVSITRGNKTPMVNSCRRPETNKEFPKANVLSKTYALHSGSG